MLRPLEGIDGDQATDDLLAYFGSMRVALSASPREQLRAVGDQRVVAYLGVIRQSMRWVLRAEVETRTMIGTPQALRDYLRLSHGSDRYEQVRVFYLDVRGRLMREESFDRGTPDQAIVCVSQIITRGLELGSRILLIVHNHPSGDPSPSKSDKDVTRRLGVAAHSVGMSLHDHLIVAEGADFSFRENGLV